MLDKTYYSGMVPKIRELCGGVDEDGAEGAAHRGQRRELWGHT